jgi:integrase
MVLPMAQPFKHPKTGVWWFRRVVPRELRALVGKREVIRSLRTKDRKEALLRHLEVSLEVARHWEALRSPAASLSQKEIMALAGVYYRETVAGIEEEPGLPETFSHWLRLDREAADAGALERWVGPCANDLLRRQGLHIDAPSRARLLSALNGASIQAAEHLKRNAEGDYGHDPKASRFPEWSPKGAGKPPPAKGRTSLTEILEDWWKEAKATGRKPSTYESYSNTVKGFIAHLGHEDAARVSPDDVVSFKDHRLASLNPRTGKPISPKTVKDSDLVALKTLCGWAVGNRRLAANPAKGIPLKLGQRRVTRPKGFTDDEAAALLQAADKRERGNERPKTFAAKRWVPWLCAYTGARVGEIVQLRKQDVRRLSGHWTIHITPEAGAVKTNRARDVVLHEHLVEKGFPQFAEASADGPLFLTPAKDGDVLGPLQGVKNRLAEAAREIVADPRVQPNHGWRHRFKTVTRSVGLDGRVVDAIQGHAARTAGDDYGDVTVAAMALAMAKFPRQA